MILEGLIQSFPSLKSGFVHSSLFYACIFFVAVALGLLLGMAFPKKSTASRSARFVFACVFLTLATIFYTLLIFLCSSLFPLDSFLAMHSSAGFSRNSYYGILLGIFLCGVLISLFWKISLPVFVILGALFTFFNHYILASEFGEQVLSVRLTVEEEKIIIDGYEIPKADGENQLELSVLSLPETFPLPLRRNWFCIKNIQSAHTAKNKDSFISKLMANSAVESYKNSILLKNRFDFQQSIPTSTVYPALFSAQITFENGSPTCHFSKDL